MQTVHPKELIGKSCPPVSPEGSPYTPLEIGNQFGDRQHYAVAHPCTPAVSLVILHKSAEIAP